MCCTLLTPQALYSPRLSIDLLTTAYPPDNAYNPFARRESHSPASLNSYRVLAPLSWALVIVFGIFYSIHKPADVSNSWTLWSQFERRSTAFSVNIVVLAIYWYHYLLSFYTHPLHQRISVTSLQDPPSPLPDRVPNPTLFQGCSDCHCSSQRGVAFYSEQPLRLRVDPPLDQEPFLAS